MTSWPLVPLGELLERRKDEIDVQEDQEYARLRIRMNGKGIDLRDRVLGNTIRTKRQFVARANQLVLSKIDARNGAFGILPSHCDQAIITGNFWAFEVKDSRLDAQFFEYFTKTRNFLDFCIRASEGTTNRRYLQEPQFLRFRMPLPKIEEQRRIVAVLEEVRRKVTETQDLANQCTAERIALMPSALGAVFRDLAKKHGTVSLRELCKRITDGPHKTPQYVAEGIPFVTVQNMVTGTLKFTNLKHISVEDHAEFIRRCNPEKGDVLYSKDGATRGWPCLVDTDRPFSIFVSVALLKPLRDKLDGRFLCHLLRSSLIRDRMEEKSRGDMIPHIVLGQISDFPVPKIPVEYQKELVSKLDRWQALSDTLASVQSAREIEVTALMPSVLNQAFSGKLLTTV